jgi:hypothetical protein
VDGPNGGRQHGDGCRVVACDSSFLNVRRPVPQCAEEEKR